MAVTCAGAELLLRFDLARLSQTYACPSSIFIDEFYSRGFESSPDHIESSPTRTARSIFQLMNRNGTDSSSLGEILLAPRD
jgi:hypothetical protein